MAEEQNEPETPKESDAPKEKGPQEDEVIVALRGLLKSGRAFLKAVTNTVERPAQETAKTYLKKASDFTESALSAIEGGDSGKKKDKKK